MTEERRNEMVRALPRLIASLAVSVLIAGVVSALLFGLIPATHRAAASYTCPAGTVCTDLRTVLVLAAPGVALAMCTIVGTFIYALTQARRRAR